MIFNCTHEFKDLVVYSDSTKKDNEEHPKDFINVTHHLYCTRCDTALNLGYAKIIGGTNEFLKNI